MIEGKDIASFQPNFSPAATDDFVFIKASEGTGYRNPDANAQAQRSRVGGRVIGWYHYLHRGGIQAQADYFVASPGIVDGDLLFCDWEGSAIPTVAEMIEFIKTVKVLRPHSKVGMYCNTYTWNNVNTSKYAGDFLFIADYNKPVPTSPWTIWQYSDGGGQLDHDRAKFASRAAMLAWSRGLIPQPPKPPIFKFIPYWLSLLLEARKKDIHAPRTVCTHKATTLAVERALKVWGCPVPLLVDGHYGTSTDDAVRWFQTKVSGTKSPDGILGPLEWARLAAGPAGRRLFAPMLGNYKRWIA